MSHTPLYRVEKHTTYDLFSGRESYTLKIVAPDKSFIAMLGSGKEANAAYIVEACNNYAALKKSHAQMLEALTMCQSVLEHASDVPGVAVKCGLDCERCWIDKAIAAAESLERK